MKSRPGIAALLAALACPPAIAHTVTYTTALAGTTAGTGQATVIIDNDLATIRIIASFSDLTGATTLAHIHCCTTQPGVEPAAVATMLPSFPGFPSGVMAGSYDQTFSLVDTATYSSSFLTGSGGTALTAMNTLLAALDQGRAYLNIHTSFLPAGEISGFPSPVPLPAAAALCVPALIGLFGIGRRPRSPAPTA